MVVGHVNGADEVVKMMVSALMISRKKSIRWDTNKAKKKSLLPAANNRIPEHQSFWSMGEQMLKVPTTEPPIAKVSSMTLSCRKRMSAVLEMPL